MFVGQISWRTSGVNNELKNNRAKNNSLKSIVVVFGAMSFEWLAIGLVFKPWLDKTRASMGKSRKHLATAPPIKVQKLASLRSMLILPKK
ncbi:hypothetical protein H5410_011559 [Solanum commersonii]|uniref:Uncharacterized protein n=1 Tax=Solanum commersonii TaxID=4109 RepID=A0A9J6ANZ4_SOLCO|nr:hypothetical protein H5410_011559 [Solanum commersonii]